MPTTAPKLPYIDPDVEHVGVSRLRKLNASVLRGAEKTLVIQENDKPLAVLLTYDQFMHMQREMEQLASTVELLSDQQERRLLLKGVQSAREGRAKSLRDIRKSLKP